MLSINSAKYLLSVGAFKIRKTANKKAAIVGASCFNSFR